MSEIRVTSETRRTTSKPRALQSSGPARCFVTVVVLFIALAAPDRVMADQRTGPFNNQTRQGMDYRSFAAQGGSEECRAACAVEGQCRAWTYKRAHRNRTYDNADDAARCYLKSGIPQPTYDRCCVSGVKPPPPAVAKGHYRPPPPPVTSRQ